MPHMVVYRLAHALHRARVPVLPRALCLVNRVLFALVLPASARVGRGVLFGYQGLGIVVHAEAVIGDRVVVATGVTIGGTGRKQGVPVIEDDVYIGSGAKLLGPIRIGRGARIGANAVVLCDVPAGAVAVGIPARVLPAAAAEFTS
jgi:serine O-acetyltransferase